MSALREAFLLEDAERTAAGYPAAERARMRALARAAAERALVAERALDRHPATALALYREAALLSMAARVSVEDGPALAEPLVAAEVVARFRALPARRPAPFAPDALEDLTRFVAEPDQRASPDDARALVRWLGTLVERRGVDELRFLRRFRAGAAGAAALALAVVVASSLFGRPNLALHKPVTASGVHPASTAVPGGLTDGVISGAPYGIHTNEGEAPWAQVDLLGEYALDEVRIYNRGDGYLEDGMPLTLQISRDGLRFADVETRAKTFTRSSPWVAKLHGSPARFVRVRGARGKYVCLSELEAYGKPAR
jgi:hypothetical protein